VCDPSQLTDEQLLQEHFGRPGHEYCDTILVERFTPDVARTVRRQLHRSGGEQAVDSCIVDTWSLLYRIKHRFENKGPGSARKWVKGIARKVAMKTRSTRRRPEPPELAPPTPGSFPELDRQEQLAELHRCIRALPVELQAVLLLARPQAVQATSRNTSAKSRATGLGSHTYQQVADLLKYRKPDAIFRQLERAIRLLQEKMGVEAIRRENLGREQAEERRE
jgi:hypothetical protein